MQHTNELMLSLKASLLSNYTIAVRCGIICLLICCSLSVLGKGTKSSELTRMIVTSDIGGSDPDDTQSLVHLLTMLTDVELEGFISQHAWVPYGTSALKVINSVIDGYEKVLPNLKVHNKNYPSANYLRSIVKVGQSKAAMAGVGDGKDSEGSQWIIDVVDKKDSRPVWIAAWSGMNTLAQAIWTVKKTRTPSQFKGFISKIRIYDVLGQDDAGAWIAKNFPEILYIRNVDVYGWPLSDSWYRKNVQTVGPLGACYPNREWGIEGDTPSFLYCISNGLNSPEHIDYGGWGGRFSLEKKAGIRGMDWVVRNGLDETQYDEYLMHPSTNDAGKVITRWQEAIHNDFQARMQWTVVSDYSKANHHPIAVVDGDRSRKVIYHNVKAVKKIVLDACKSSDPDGNIINYKWSHYVEPSSYKGAVDIDTSIQGRALVQIPQEAKGKTIHIVLEVTDNGQPQLTSYRRVVLHIK